MEEKNVIPYIIGSQHGGEEGFHPLGTTGQCLGAVSGCRSGKEVPEVSSG